MKKILVALFLMVLVGVGGLVLWTATLDWNKYQGKIVQEFYDATGKDIVFEGPVSFKILPSPYLQASNVKIYNHLAKGGQPLVTIGKLSIDVSLQELINGNLYVTRMLLENPLVNIEINDEGKLNWERPLTQEQRQKLENSNIRLNSVSLANASVVVDYPSKAYNLRLDNLNGEIMTQTVLGPYRIEGNYMKGSTPEGFAISVGKLSESFPTTLDFALTHPLSNSYIRFDGNFQLSNKVFNGNIVLESQNLKRFVEDNFKDVGLADAYNYPLAMTFDINTTEQQINLANMVIKYGNSQGAGSAQIPIEDILNIGENSIKPRVAMAFNFTDLDLSPLVYTFNDFTKRYKNSGNIYNPDWPIDLQLDLKSLRTQYNNQPVKNFEASLDLIDNIINFNNVTAVLPGDTDLKLKGDLSSLDDQPFYNLELSFSSVDFSKLLSWFGYTPEVVVPSTYRKAEGGAKISGSVDKIFISPYSLTIDKSSFAGEAGLKLGGARKDMMLTINGDSVNFDNYIAEMPVEEKAKSWLERMKYRFNKLGFLNDFDMQLKTKLDLAIYNTVPFENIDLNVSLFDGKADIEKLTIGSVYNSKFEISGLLKGFGGVPGFENLKYHVTTADFQNLSEKLELKIPQVDYKKMKNFDGQGIMTGNFGKLAIESVSKLEKLEINYKGQVDNEKPNLMLDGDFEIKHPDFVTMLQDIGLKYNPQVYTMGLFDLKTKFIGSGNEFVARPLEFNIGYNKFSGSLDYDTAGERPNVFATLGINKFEIDKFFGTKKDVSQAPQINIANDDSENEFLAKPYWEKDVFDFAFLSKYNVSGDFSVDELTYKSHAFEKASMSVALVNDNLAINNFSARYNGGDLKGNFTLNAAENPNVSGSASFVGTEVNNLGIGGKKYALKEGKYNSEVTFNGNFSSFDDFIKNLKASVKFSIDASEVRGWNLADIYKDISVRENSDGLTELMNKNLSSGTTKFSKITGNISIANNAFSIPSLYMQGNGVKINASGEGDLANWTANLLFNVKYDEPQYLPGYSFELKGPMNAPALAVNVNSLLDMYKGRQEKILEQEQAIKEAEITRMVLLVAEQRKNSEQILEEAQNRLASELKSMKDTVESEDAKVKYDDLLKQLNDEVVQITKLISTSQSVEPTQKLVDNMSEANKKSTVFLEKIRRSIRQIYLQDLAFQMDGLYKDYNDASSKMKETAAKLQSDRAVYEGRLEQIQSSFRLEGDSKLVLWEREIKKLEENNLTTDKIVEEGYNAHKSSKNEEDIIEFSDLLRNNIKQVEDYIVQIEKVLKEYNDYADSRVKVEEDGHALKIRSEEVERKLNENTGFINIKKSGKNIIVRRDIEEIEETEKQISQEKVRVLDFSKPKTKEVEKETDNKNVVKRGW